MSNKTQFGIYAESQLEAATPMWTSSTPTPVVERECRFCGGTGGAFRRASATSKVRAAKTVCIDQRRYTVRAGALTGVQLRGLPTTPVGPEFDLYLEESGTGEDRPVGDSDSIAVVNGMRFFVVPRMIGAG
jgi:hypothetical protein